MILEAMKWIASIGVDNVIFELDAKLVADSFNSQKVNNSELGAIVSLCKIFSCSNFTNSEGGDKRMKLLTF